ncbi:MAG: PfkB family carbohydrate kinase [Anaerolineae bacterium]|nr:PfkB family carbohydrate kinase [Anaerolineae bacterium]
MFDLMVVGNLAYDDIITPFDRRKGVFGGSVAYAALCAARLGQKVGVVSKVGQDYDMSDLAPLSQAGVDVAGVKQVDGATTRFECVYDEQENREQRLLGACAPILPEDIPDLYLQAKKVALLPIFDELPYQTVARLAAGKSLVCMDPQGYLRSVGQGKRACPEPFDSAQDKRGRRVVQRAWDDKERFLEKVDVLATSLPELEALAGTDDPGKAVRLLAGYGPQIVLVTREGGARTGFSSFVYCGGRLHKVPAIPPRAFVDPGGAGDSSATAFFIEYERTGDPSWSALFASGAASFVMEGFGASNFGTRDQIMGRIGDFVAAHPGQPIVQVVEKWLAAG